MRLLPLLLVISLFAAFSATAQISLPGAPAVPAGPAVKAAATPAPAPGPALPSAADTTVELVQVDVTGKDAAEAKAAALRQATADAFKQLVHKLYSDTAPTLIAKADPSVMESLIHDKHIETEKIDGAHYQGVLTFHFDPAKLVAFVQATLPPVPVAGTAEAAINTHSVLLIPVLQYNESTQLWEDDNTWRKSWNRVALQVGRGALIVPYGDRRDREEIGAEEGVSGDFKDFAPIADRYGVKEVYIAIAEYQSTDLSQGVSVQLRKLSEKGITTETIRFDAEERETRAEQLDRVALALARRLTKIKGTTTETFQNQRDNEITLDVAHNGFDEFETIRTKLEAVPSVKRLRINKVSYNTTNITLVYHGSPDQLGKSFAAQGFRIYKKGDSLLLALPQ